MNHDTKSYENYRSILATANRLETIQGNLESVIDFFLTPIVKLYSKLCDDCLKLLFECEFNIDHFRKVEELIWKRIYHDVYRFHKTKRQRIRRHEESLVESHFISGIGFYSSLIVRLRLHYRIHVSRGVIHPLNLALGAADDFATSSQANQVVSKNATVDEESSDWTESPRVVSGPAEEWARQAIYRSLVYMGDLARYLLETSQFNYQKLAFEFYKSASRNQPQHGLPYNQLATLSGSQNHNLDAVCNYIRCATKPKPFDGVEGNLRKIFELNKRVYEELRKTGWISKVSDVFSSKDPIIASISMIRGLIVLYIKLISDIWTAMVSEDCDSVYSIIVDETRMFFECLCEALELEPIIPLADRDKLEHEFNPLSSGSSSGEKPKYVSPTIMFEFCSISIMLIAKNRMIATTSSKCLASLIDTLALNLLHYSTSKCQKVIISKLQEVRLTRENCSSLDKSIIHKHDPNSILKSSGGNLSSDSQKSNENPNTTAETTNKRALSRIRQRKAASNYSDTTTDKSKSNVNQSEDTDMSELEETALSTIDALEISSEMSDEGDFEMDNLIDLSSSDGGSGSSHGLPGSVRKSSQIGQIYKLSRPKIRPTRSQTYSSDRTNNLAGSSNSLPVPDLLTGDDVTKRFDSKSFGRSVSPEGATNHARKSLTRLNDASPCNEDPEKSINRDVIMTHVYSQTFLPTIKVYCDWLLSDSSVIGTNLESFRSFSIELGRLVSLLTDLLVMVESIPHGYTSAIYEHVYDGPSWIQKYPLSCDFTVCNLEPLRSVHELNIDFDFDRELREGEAGFITTQCMIAFNQALKAFLENKV